jgi:hypothetical protein
MKVVASPVQSKRSPQYDRSIFKKEVRETIEKLLDTDTKLDEELKKRLLGN